MQTVLVRTSISREKLKRGDHTPDSEEVLGVVESSEEERQARLEAAAEFVWHQIKGKEKEEE